MELQKQNYQLVSVKTQLEQSLASKVQDIRALKKEIQEMEGKIKDLTKSNQTLQSQVETLQLQVHGVYMYSIYTMCLTCVSSLLDYLPTYTVHAHVHVCTNQDV